MSYEQVIRILSNLYDELINFNSNSIEYKALMKEIKFYENKRKEIFDV